MTSVSGKPQRTTMTLCRRPVELQDEVLRRRIYSPQSYASVRDIAVVPIVHSECAALACWFPLVWRRSRDGFEFVAVRSLLDDQQTQPPAARGLLPLILRAYPFILDPRELPGSGTRRLLDDVFADAPTDAGATITTVQGRLSRATASRFRFLDRYATDAAATAEISSAIAALDAFEPWSLMFDIEGHHVEIRDLLVIRPAVFECGMLSSLLKNHGTYCAAMLSLHRISLFRAGGLVAMARRFLTDRRIAQPNSADRDQGHSAPDLVAAGLLA